MPRGGKRSGAGRPKKNREVSTKTAFYDSAMDYLEAVVSGREAADPARIQAAKTLISYQNQKVRVPKENPTPKKMRRNESRNAERNRKETYEKKAAKIIKLHEERAKNET